MVGQGEVGGVTCKGAVHMAAASFGCKRAEFDVEIKYRSGRKNANADSLSRSPTLPAYLEEDGTIRQAATDSVGEMDEQQRADPKLDSSTGFTASP